MRETRRERIRDGERELVMGEDGEMIRERERERERELVGALSLVNHTGLYRG